MSMEKEAEFGTNRELVRVLPWFLLPRSRMQRTKFFALLVSTKMRGSYGKLTLQTRLWPGPVHMRKSTKTSEASRAWFVLQLFFSFSDS